MYRCNIVYIKGRHASPHYRAKHDVPWYKQCYTCKVFYTCIIPVLREWAGELLPHAGQQSSSNVITYWRHVHCCCCCWGWWWCRCCCVSDAWRESRHQRAVNFSQTNNISTSKQADTYLLLLFYYCFCSISFFLSFFLSLFLCQQHYEKTAEPICMKFSGKMWSDHGTTWLNFGSIRVNGSAGRRSICYHRPLLRVSCIRQGAGFVVPRTTVLLCFLSKRTSDMLK